MDRQSKIKLAQLLMERAKRKKDGILLAQYSDWYPWQREVCEKTNTNGEVCLCAANRVGKTLCGTGMDAFHLLGEYPDDYPGHRFKHAPLIWCCGYSMEKTRDLLQTKLFGQYDKTSGFDGGLVPKDKIKGWESAGGTSNAMRTVKVKHKLGTSVVQFWSYSQGQHAIMGDEVDWIHVDEEPKDQSIRPQLLTRTLTGDRGSGGKILYTFTPENGRTSLVIKFMDDCDDDQFFKKVAWRDAPHITPEMATKMLSKYPEHQRLMRSEGEPMLGHGRIYDIADEFILCDPFEIPDFWDVIAGMDFGDDHPQAFVKLAFDPDNDIVYVVNSWKARRVSANDAWGATKSWIKGVPVAWPPDGLQKEKGRDDAVELKKHYVRAGFKMLPEHSTWISGGNSVESGLYKIKERQSKGLWKVFKGQIDYMEEHRNYHRAPVNSEFEDVTKIVKKQDDIMDATRYAFMMRRKAIKAGKVGQNPIQFRMPRPVRPMGVGAA